MRNEIMVTGYRTFECDSGHKTVVEIPRSIFYERRLQKTVYNPLGGEIDILRTTNEGRLCSVCNDNIKHKGNTKVINKNKN